MHGVLYGLLTKFPIIKTCKICACCKSMKCIIILSPYTDPNYSMNQHFLHIVVACVICNRCINYFSKCKFNCTHMESLLLYVYWLFIHIYLFHDAIEHYLLRTHKNHIFVWRKLPPCVNYTCLIEWYKKYHASVLCTCNFFYCLILNDRNCQFI